MKFLKKNWGNLLFFAIIVLLLIPQTSMPIKVFVTRLISFSPSETDVEERVVLTDYNWPLQTLTGEKVNLTKSEGKVTIINLWATWCPPCVAEMPSFQKLHDAYGDKIDFYFVSSETEEKITAFIKKHEYTMPVYLESHAPPTILQTQSIPQTYVIGKDGTVVMDESGAANWNSDSLHEILDRLLAQ